MGVPSTTAAETFIGAGDLYVDDELAGATLDNNVWRIVQEKGSPKFNGSPGPLLGIDYISSETAEMECTIPNLADRILAMSIPGSVSVVGDAVAASFAGGDTTLDGATAAGDETFDVTDATGIIVGDLIQIGAAGAREFRVVTVVASDTLTVDYPLTKAHANLDPVKEVADTALSDDAEPGSTNLKIASVTGLAVGDYLRFGVSAEAEVRELTFVGTTGAGGTGVSFTFPTVHRHRTGDNAFEQTNEGSTTISSNVGVARRVPTSGYHKFELRVPGVDGREVRFRLLQAIVTDNAEYEATDDPTKPLAPRLTFQARWIPAPTMVSPWEIEKIGPTV